MVKIIVYRNNESIEGFNVHGHANKAPHGHDIVCAGISALTQACVLGLQNHLQRKLDLHVASGSLEMTLVDKPDALSNAILETMCMGLNEICRLYPESVCMLERRR